MNYEKMSDFDVNKAVAINRGGYQGYVEHMANGVKESDRDSHGLFYVERDYCGNPSDAMPILIESKIGFKWVNDDCAASSVLCGYHESTSDNPLRAAMTVFLMMREDAQCLKP